MATFDQLRLGIVGVGAMGGAIARGLVASGAVDASQLCAADQDAAKLAELEQEAGVRACDSALSLAQSSVDAVLLAVKPQVIAAVMAELAPALAGKLVISIAAGVPLATLEAALPGARVVRVMPNLPLQVLSGASAVAPGHTATADDAALVQGLFAALGSAQLLTESQLDVAGAVSGCGPAFFALYADQLTRAGVAAGLPTAACRELVLTTMRGVAQQLLESGEHPRAYMDKVTSPGGTTAAALRAMESQTLSASFDAVDAALARTAELAR